MNGGVRGWMLVLAPLAVLAFAGCTASPETPPPGAFPPIPGGVASPLVMQCAPFARAVSGVGLRGAAADWWSQADGRYAKTQRPSVGAVLVFQRSTRLADGHVAVVSAIQSEREIWVTHANWLRDWVSEDAPVVDVSPDNDWSQVRVWWPPTGQLGTAAYATFGFITPERPLTREDMVWITRQLVTPAAGS